MREKLIQLRYKTYLILLDLALANGVHLSLLTGGGKLSTIKTNVPCNFRLLLILLPAGERGSYGRTSWLPGKIEYGAQNKAQDRDGVIIGF